MATRSAQTVAGRHAVVQNVSSMREIRLVLVVM
jgi:hypothetical protein